MAAPESRKRAIIEAAGVLGSARRAVAFTGAGISAESGIPTFRGANGLWSTYDPEVLSIDFFYRHPEKAWNGIREIFYTHFQEASPNGAHYFLADAEKRGILQSVITQNIDGLHQQAGSSSVIEYHGTSARLVCMGCGHMVRFTPAVFLTIPPCCQDCGGLLKPDFVFFGEMIPESAMIAAERETLKADLWLVIGTTGEIVPASMLPWEAKRNGAMIVEINPKPSNFTRDLSDIYLQGPAVEITESLAEHLF